ncbi:NAD(P)-dependent oxidoreductase [Pseudoxanthomonas winnipegensis]|jgi:putative NADH-flavin reductase|uniref:NAD(P)-dependent oxidoreductase n=1 Tax=Pseudoxanthomonas winnipegensis TaxID=2480810 RepID=A0ABY1WJX1_9GAMM|nr:NAD(P)-dependent oxidoreductase [Pseudoxanthomonas winnipegensis]TAA09696.1 NAD(P)-dependent oxidoreductase [Pseudoxanthomonas winnipegensis]TAA22926.1 NAD(P)-dependent oxidoreductase [Pseudoxanthomonas winnipegensis]TAH73337.1 NAD(P)-dependent oxidoreductase [Pseudoxanthomonas winnipegensis]
MASIALLGGTGNVGRRLLAEALRRGHTVTVIARKPVDDLPEGVAFVQGDITADPAGLGAKLTGHDVLISAARFAEVTPEHVLTAVRAAKIPRLAVVGGAGSLEVAPGVRLVDTPEFPAAYKSEALPGATFLDELRGVKDITWTFLSPAAFFGPGERTGQFRLGGDAFLTDAKGESRISYEDYAVALLDEIESPKHSGQRFSVLY